MRNWPADVRRDEIEKIPRGGSKPSDAKFFVKEQRRCLRPGQQIVEVVGCVFQLADLVLKLAVDRTQFLIERLQLLF